MTDFEKRLGDAAFDFSNDNADGTIATRELTNISFRTGARWGYAQAECEIAAKSIQISGMLTEIQRLHQALEWYTHDMEVRKIEGKHYICPQKDSDSDGALFYAIGKRARDALKVGKE
jgi:hypothetical protein